MASQSPTKHDLVKNAIREIAVGTRKLENRLENDVTEVCKLLIGISNTCKAMFDLMLPQNLDLKSRLQNDFSDIYCCLKLHLASHLGEDSALNHEELEKFGRDILELSDEQMNALPDGSHAIDPGSKLLETVCSIMIVLCFVHAENPCNEAQFWVEDEEGKSLCIECNECPPGHGLSRNCGQRISPEAMVICERCKAGFSFSSNYDVSSCLPCNPPCVKDQIVLQNCTTKTNVKCKSECYSKNRYYDNKLGCLPCSKCCGDGKDEVEDECKQKLGPASDMICSFNSSANRCAPTTTTTKMKSTQSNFTLNTTAPHNSVSSTDQNSTSLQFEEKHSHHGIAVIVSILCVELFGIILVTAAFQYRCFSSRRWSCLRPTGTDAAEIGRELYTKAVTDAPLVLCNKESKPLGSLVEHDSILQRICEVLDSRPPGCGNYRAVAQHYGFDHYQIESVLKQFGGGPSRALIESLAATQPELKIEEFAEVTEKKTKRKDVVKLLIEYDSAEVESL